MDQRNPINPKYPLHQPVPFGHPLEMPIGSPVVADAPVVPRRNFAEQIAQPKYAFPGLTTYIDAAFADGEVEFQDNSLRHKVKGIWFTTQAANALGNACFQKPEDATKSVERAFEMRDALRFAADAIDAAAAEVADKLDLTFPDPF